MRKTNRISRLFEFQEFEMKILIVSIISLSLLFLQCQTGKNGQNPPDNAGANSMQKTDFTKKFDDIEIKYSVDSTQLPKVTINYEIKNTGAKNYIVFNQGHTNISNPDDVYIEEKNGIVEISQKAFREPTDIICPPTIAPIHPRAALLKAGGSLKGKAFIEEMRTHTPYDYCRKDAIKNVSPSKAVFCLGIAEGGAETIDENGTVRDREIAARQKVLCSDEIVLK